MALSCVRAAAVSWSAMPSAIGDACGVTERSPYSSIDSESSAALASSALAPPCRGLRLSGCRMRSATSRFFSVRMAHLIAVGGGLFLALLFDAAFEQRHQIDDFG